LLNDFHPRELRIAGRLVRCASPEELILLKEAKVVEENSAGVPDFTIGRLHMIKDAWLGKRQRLVSQAIDRLSS
jgi:hypothetical protein